MCILSMLGIGACSSEKTLKSCSLSFGCISSAAVLFSGDWDLRDGDEGIADLPVCASFTENGKGYLV